MKHGGIVVDDEKFLNYIQEKRTEGMTEKDIASSLRMTIMELRRNRTDSLRRIHGLPPLPPDYKGSLGKKEVRT